MYNYADWTATVEVNNAWSFVPTPAACLCWAVHTSVFSVILRRRLLNLKLCMLLFEVFLRPVITN
jgi:hypothetical protein